MAPGATPAPGTKVNVFQQLLGNVGRYNPLGNMNNQFGGSQGPLGGGAIGTVMAGQVTQSRKIVRAPARI